MILLLLNHFEQMNICLGKGKRKVNAVRYQKIAVFWLEDFQDVKKQPSND